MVDWKLEPINQADHTLETLDLVQRAADYVTLEVSRAPDLAFVKDFFETAPPGLTRNDLQAHGIRSNGRLVGVIGIAHGYEFPTDWWIGLMLIDPALRGQGIGAQVVAQLIEKANAAGIIMIKLAVLLANPHGLRFWENQGFEFHRPAPAQPGSDGHDRVVLKYRVRKDRT